MNNIKEITQKPILIYREMLLNLGILESVFLAQLIEIEFYNRQKDHWFSCTNKLMQQLTGIGPVAQKKIRKKLQEMGLLEYQKKGMPAKNYYILNQAELILLIDNSVGE
ncbi:MAG: hypothetical protein SVO01_02930 [Thermotogota bacterium]|nr:hypothetical protein [Thermotogota bacterium]